MPYKRIEVLVEEFKVTWDDIEILDLDNIPWYFKNIQDNLKPYERINIEKVFERGTKEYGVTDPDSEYLSIKTWRKETDTEYRKRVSKLRKNNEWKRLHKV